MFLTDCDKSHLFFRHGEIQVPATEDNHSDGNQSRSFGPGDIQGQAFGQPPTNHLPPSLRPASIKTRSAGLRSGFLFQSLLLCARPSLIARGSLPFPVWGAGAGRQGKGRRKRGEESWATGKPVALDRKVKGYCLTGQEISTRLCEAPAGV